MSFIIIIIIHPLHPPLEARREPPNDFPPSLPTHCFTGILADRSPGNPLPWNQVRATFDAGAAELAPLQGKEAEGRRDKGTEGALRYVRDWGVVLEGLRLVPIGGKKLGGWGWGALVHGSLGFCKLSGLNRQLI